MKARVKATGEIVEAYYIEGDYLHTDDGLYLISELEGIESGIDYWTRLEHQAAIAAMQGIMMTHALSDVKQYARLAIDVAHALVEKMKSNN